MCMASCVFQQLSAVLKVHLLFGSLPAELMTPRILMQEEQSVTVESSVRQIQRLPVKFAILEANV